MKLAYDSLAEEVDSGGSCEGVRTEEGSLCVVWAWVYHCFA